METKQCTCAMYDELRKVTEKMEQIDKMRDAMHTAIDTGNVIIDSLNQLIDGDEGNTDEAKELVTQAVKFIAAMKKSIGGLDEDYDHYDLKHKAERIMLFTQLLRDNTTSKNKVAVN